MSRGKRGTSDDYLKSTYRSRRAETLTFFRPGTGGGAGTSTRFQREGGTVVATFVGAQVTDTGAVLREFLHGGRVEARRAFRHAKRVYVGARYLDVLWRGSRRGCVITDYSIETIAIQGARQSNRRVALSIHFGRQVDLTNRKTLVPQNAEN